MRSFRVALTLGLVGVIAAGIHAQIPGRNVNMVSGGTFPGGDPYLQKQNEPSIAISARNLCHVVGGANDYRAVNLPGLPGDVEIGDAWVGWYESTDCGATWYSTLVPGYLQDNSPLGLASPVKGLTTGADPVVRSGAAGTFYYLFIAFNRGSNVGKLALARAIDHNDREAFINPDRVTDVSARSQRSPIAYIDTIEVARGSAGQFIDKPFLAVFPGTGTCTMDGETVPATTVYVSWTEFLGNGSTGINRTRVNFARSTDCGQTWRPTTKLTEGYPYNQGSVIGVSPNGQEVSVFWRQIRGDHNGDAILYARSVDAGKTFTKAQFVPGLGEGQFSPFDQNTTSRARGALTTTYRTVAYATVAHADDGYLYLAVSQVPGPPSGNLGGAQARITLLRTNGTTWEGPVTLFESGADGQQFMPSLTYAAGKLQLIWYDVRYDEATLNRNDTLIDEVKALAVSRIRRTVDLLGAQAALPSASFPPAFQLYGISQPDYNDLITIPDPNDPSKQIQVGAPRGPRISQYLIGDPNPATPQGYGPRQLEFNRGILLLYGGGTIPFLGDYVDIAQIPWVLNANGRWVFNGVANAANTALSTFQAAWTDNRNAGIGKATTTTLPDGTTVLNYVSPTPLLPGQTINDVQCPAGVDNTQTRDANVYTSRITNEFSLTVPTNNKPTTTPGAVRAFSVQLSNNVALTPGTQTSEPETLFKLKVISSAASFSRDTFLSGTPNQTCSLAPGQSPVTQIFVSLLPRTSAARTVYVKCGAAGRVVVTAIRMLDPNTEGPSASVVLNADSSTPGTKDPDGAPLGFETHNPDAENPDAENPDAENPDAENPDAENPDAENPDAENPDAENPDAENPDAENPDAENPDAENPDAENANFQDVSVDVTNHGNTTSAYQVKVQSTTNTNGYGFQLTAYRAYATPGSINCALVKRYANEQLFSIQSPDMSGAFLDETAPTIQNTTILIRPGESIRVKLRAVWDAQTTQPFCSTDPASADYCFNKIRFKAKAEAPNTGDTAPPETSYGVGGVTLQMTGQPGESIGEQPIKPDVKVKAKDSSGAPLPGIPVTIAIDTNPSAATLSGTLTKTTDETGVATFSDLVINRGGYGYTLKATVGSSATPVTSDLFDVVGFAPTADLPAARYYHTAALLNDGKVLIAGGVNSSGYLASAVLYDPDTGTFSATGSMATARAFPTTVVLPSGKVLVTGGFQGVTELNSAELYDPATGTFTSAGTMVGPGRDGHSATLLPNGKVLIAGGNTNSASLSDAQLYDPATGEFAGLESSMTTARTRHTATLLSNGKVLITGGDVVGVDVAIASAELFDPATNTFTATGSMATARDQHTATRLFDGRVLIVGGRNGALRHASTEIYNPATGTFSAGADMSEVRTAATATLLQDGTVLVAGGVGADFIRGAEVYLPSTDVFATTDGMDTARDLFTATLLFDGRVLIVGGNTASGATAGAELYLPPPGEIIP